MYIGLFWVYIGLFLRNKDIYPTHTHTHTRIHEEEMNLFFRCISLFWVYIGLFLRYKDIYLTHTHTRIHAAETPQSFNDLSIRLMDACVCVCWIYIFVPQKDTYVHAKETPQSFRRYDVSIRTTFIGFFVGCRSRFQVCKSLLCEYRTLWPPP